MNNKLIDKVYKGLFIYTIGFHNMIKKIITIAANNFGVLSSIWKVYALLLEHVDGSNYQFAITECIIFYTDSGKNSQR